MRLWVSFALAILILWAQPASIACGWGWFVVPLGAPPIGWAHAFGLSLLLNASTTRQAAQYVKAKPTPEDDPDGIRAISKTATLVLMSWALMAAAHYLPIWWVS